MSIAAGYHTPSTQNSTPRFSTARIGSVTGGASGAVVSVVTGGHSFRGTRRAVAEPVPSGDASLGETGGVDPTTLTFRPRSGRWMTGVVAALALYGIGSLAVAGEPLTLVRYAPGLLLVTAVVWAAYWQPAVIVSDAGVTVRNVLRTVELPWPSIQRIDTRYALTLITAYGSYAAWAAPAPGRSPSRSSRSSTLAWSSGPTAARERAIELLRTVEIPDPRVSIDKYPHQLSGGQRQRAMIDRALSLDPTLLIADEPTTALDVTVQAEILKLMRELRERIDAGILLITHDMGVVADLADRLLVMKDGRVVERGSADEIFNRPQHPYTKQLLAAVPHLLAHAEVDVTERPREGIVSGSAAEPVMEAKGLVLEYPGRGRIPAFRAVDGIDLTIDRGEVVGLVGESGSGKTTVGRAMVGLLPVMEGSLRIGGHEMAGIGSKELRELRRNVSIVFQDPGSSLNPRLPIGQSIGEPLLLHKIASGAELHRKVEDLLDQVHLERSMRNRYPHELSGGQRQRVGIARALALSPKLLVADEPTSALDVSVQARVLDLFQELQREYGFACLFISHDLAVVEILSTRIAVMH